MSPPAPGVSLRPAPAVMPGLRLRSLQVLRMPAAELAAFVAGEVERNAFLGDAPGAARRGRAGPVRGPAPAADVDSVAAPGPSLREHLAGQVNAGFRDPSERLVALRLVDMLDGDGRLDGEPAAVGAALGCGAAMVEGVLARCRGLDPPGVFARSLGECLALQLARRGALDDGHRAVLGNLDLLADGDMARLGRRCGLGRAALERRVSDITALNPRPGSGFGDHVAPAAIPDVRVRRSGAGWAVELDEDAVPAVVVDRGYYARMRGELRAGGDRDFIRGQFRSADWLVRALDGRRATLLRVAAEIAARQGGFLEHGVARLEPMTIRAVAEALGMHESTVGRAVADKYIETGTGVFEMRRLFAPGFRAASRPVEAVRARIRAVVESGAAASDEGVAAALRAEGIAIARRTVAKHRREMGIAPPSRRGAGRGRAA